MQERCAGNMIDFYQIRSPLTQITDERMHRFIASLEEELGEEAEYLVVRAFANRKF